MVGNPHIGGYDPFTYDITDFVKQQSKNIVVVGVYDDTSTKSSKKPSSKTQLYGKQSRFAFFRPLGIRYTSTSGIWQSVWYVGNLLLEKASNLEKGWSSFLVKCTSQTFCQWQIPDDHLCSFKHL